EHVACVEDVSLAVDLDRSLAADIDGDQFTPVQEAGSAGRTDRFERQARAGRRCAADDHPVVMGVGEADTARREEIADMEIFPQFAGAHGRTGGRVESLADGVIDMVRCHGILTFYEKVLRSGDRAARPKRYSAC